MQFPKTRAASQKEHYLFCPMDARTVARIAGVKVGTLNSWVQRGLIPGMTIGASGRRRDIDTDTATRIAIFAGLLRANTSIDYAAAVVRTMPPGSTEAGWLYIPGTGVDPTQRTPISHRPSLDALTEHARNIEDQLKDPPVFYAALNVGRLAERVRAAELEWQQSRRAKN